MSDPHQTEAQGEAAPSEGRPQDPQRPIPVLPPIPERQRKRRYNRQSYEIMGWMLFVFSALAFTGSALRSGDIYALVASLLFLVACIVFLMPYLLDLDE